LDKAASISVSAAALRSTRTLDLAKMRTLLVICLLIGSQALAADFRGTEFGSSCAAIAARESALGSKPAQWSWSGPGFHPFLGSIFDRPVYILYLCRNDTLAIGDYHFLKHKYDDALADFLAAHSYFSSIYGSATLASSPGKTGPAAEVFPSQGVPEEFTMTWITAELIVHVDLLVDGDRSGQNWRATVVISRK
jgi:hypothetical protein